MAPVFLEEGAQEELEGLSGLGFAETRVHAADVIAIVVFAMVQAYCDEAARMLKSTPLVVQRQLCHDRMRNPQGTILPSVADDEMPYYISQLVMFLISASSSLAPDIAEAVQAFQSSNDKVDGIHRLLKTVTCVRYALSVKEFEMPLYKFLFLSLTDETSMELCSARTLLRHASKLTSLIRFVVLREFNNGDWNMALSFEQTGLNTYVTDDVQYNTPYMVLQQIGKVLQGVYDASES